MKRIFTKDTSKVIERSSSTFRLYDLFLSMFKPKSKEKIICENIKRAFSMGEIVRHKNLHWNDALLFAEDKGIDTILLNHMISFHMLLNDEKIYVLFAPVFNGGIYISAYDRDAKHKTHSMTYVF